jgi:hypothetical protein
MPAAPLVRPDNFAVSRLIQCRRPLEPPTLITGRGDELSFTNPSTTILGGIKQRPSDPDNADLAVPSPLTGEQGDAAQAPTPESEQITRSVEPQLEYEGEDQSSAKAMRLISTPAIWSTSSQAVGPQSIDPATTGSSAFSLLGLDSYVFIAQTDQSVVPFVFDSPRTETASSTVPKTSVEIPKRKTEPRPILATIKGGMDTFVVPRPGDEPPPADPYALTDVKIIRKHSCQPTLLERFDGQVTYSAASGLLPVAVSVNGLMDGSSFQAGLSPNHLFDNNALQNNSFRFTRNGQGLAVGGTAVPDAGAGIRLFKPVDGQQGVAGLGLYQRLGDSNFDLIPGLDTEIKSSQSHTTDLALAADSSLRLSQISRMSGWTTNSFLGWSELNKEGQSSVSLGRRLGDATISQAFSIEGGRTFGYSWNQMMARRIGITDLSLNSSLSDSSGEIEKLASLSLLRPFGRDLLSVNCYGGSYKSGSNVLNQRQLTTNVALPQKSGSIFLITDSLSSVNGSVRHTTMLSDGWKLGQGLNVQFGINLGGSSELAHLNSSVGYWITPDWEARFNLGATTDPATGLTQTALFGFQLVNRFNLTTFASGTVIGQVLLDGQPASQPIQIQMDDRCVNTDSHGNFLFNRTLVGTHDVGFDISSLPATINPIIQDQTVDVEQGKTVNVVLKAERIGTVRGKVTVGTDAFGNTDPTAGAGIVITDGQGHETTTNPDDSFVLGDLPIGKHTISILPSSLPPGYQIDGAASTGVAVTNDNNVPSLQFSISPHQTVEMITLPSK